MMSSDSSAGITLTDSTVFDRIKPAGEWYNFFYTENPPPKSSSSCFYVEIAPPELYSNEDKSKLLSLQQRFALRLAALEKVVESAERAKRDVKKIQRKINKGKMLSDKEIGRRDEINTIVIPALNEGLVERAKMSEEYKQLSFFAEQHTLDHQPAISYRHRTPKSSST